MTNFRQIDKDKLLEQIWKQLYSVQDPEIKLDIVNLGLIYNVQLEPSNNTVKNFTNKFEFDVKIDMTLTSPTCPMASQIFHEIHSAIDFLNYIHSIDIQLVWNPPWTKDKISKVGKMELGII